MTIITTTAEAAYLTKGGPTGNIVYPGTQTQATAAEVKGRADIAAVLNVATVTGGTIRKA